MKSSMQEFVDSYYELHWTRIHSSGCLGLANNQAHAALERGRAERDFPRTLELGAGDFEHIPHVDHDWGEYVALDLRTPQVGRLTDVRRSFSSRRLTFVTADGQLLPFRDKSVDRIVAGCLLLHLPDPMQAVREWQRVCSPSGVIDFLVPCDPGIIVRVFRRVVSERRALRCGVPRSHYRLVNSIEHISSFSRVRQLVQASLESGRELRIRYSPFPWFSSWNFNAFAVFSIVSKN